MLGLLCCAVHVNHQHSLREMFDFSLEGYCHFRISIVVVFLCRDVWKKRILKQDHFRIRYVIPFSHSITRGAVKAIL